MILRIALVVAVLALTGCAANASESGSAPTDAVQRSATPGTFVPEEDTPEEALESAHQLFPETDPADLYETAVITCGLINNVDGDIDEVARLELSEVKLSVDQAEGLLALSAKHVCPEWGGAFTEWVDGGGPDRLEQHEH